MSQLNEVSVRGVFDPVTLGLYVPSNILSKPSYLDEPTITEHATFFHELTHYYQFYGSTFGYLCLLGIYGYSTSLAEILRQLSRREGISCPAYMADWRHFFDHWEDKSFHTQAWTLQRYFQEELYGWTYPHFDIHPILKDNVPLITSPLYLRQSSGYDLAVTGQVILENQAALNESVFVATNCSKDLAKGILHKAYTSLPDSLASKYLGISTWMGTLGLSHIENVLFFTILNQQHWNYLRNLGEYTLVQNTKRVLTLSHEFRCLKEPKSEAELLRLVEIICNKAGLCDPFHAIEETRDLIDKGLDPSRSNHAVDLISSEIFSWILKNKLEAVKWPAHPLRFLQSIPILRAYFGDDYSNRSFSILNKWNISHRKFDFSVLDKHDRYSTMVYLVQNLYQEEKTRCPLYIKEKPSACASCETCSGYLPDDSIGDDCPVLSLLSELNLKLVRRKQNG